MHPKTHTEYQALRSQVCDGDTLAVRASGIYGLALKLGQMGPYGHVGIIRCVVIDDVERVMVIEENPGGGRYRPLSHYRNSQFDIFTAPHGLNGRQASAEAVKMLEGLAEYDWRDIARLARWGVARLLARVTRARLPAPTEKQVNDGHPGVICSALVAAAYKRAGWQPTVTCAWPSALCIALGAPRLAYAPSQKTSVTS